MRITRVRVYHQWQPFRGGTYTMTVGASEGVDSLVVALDTDEGLTGWGELGVVGSFYADAFASGARAGVGDLGAGVTRRGSVAAANGGQRDGPCNAGQPYVKSALDMACWDLVGKRAGQPLCQALGGQFGDTVALYNAIPLDEPEAMAARARAFLADGYRRLQVKVGTDARVDVERLLAVRDAVGDSVVLFADANGGFTLAEARRFLRATRDVEYTIEQPCASYEECRALRHDCDRPLVLDESIESLADLLLSHRHGTADGITIKLSRVGGVTRAA